jgi:hypothetical protein
VVIPRLKEFISKVESFGVEVIVCVIVRDENINTEQQKRLRGRRTLDMALEEYESLENVNYLSLESLFLHKKRYLEWISKVIDFPVDINHPEMFKYLEESPNKKYVKYVEEYWLDEVVKKGLIPFEERQHNK